MKNIKDMINICDEDMTLLEIHNALVCCQQSRSPKRIIVDIEITKNKCYTNIWVSKEN